MQKNAKDKILIVDDEELIRWTLGESLGRWGYAPLEAAHVADALVALETEKPLAVLLDIHLPDGSGLELLREIKRRQPDTIVIVVTADALVENSVAALRGGAYDFISKPINLHELEITIRNAIETQRLRREVRFTRNERLRQFSFEQIVGRSKPMLETVGLARKVAGSEVASVLLQGESGTGKDLLAKAIHYGSPRAAAPFIAINCAALPANLIESELFGYEKGAFTDAKARKEGLFEQAEGGTLFLDEIGELELGLQAKLLRVLEDGTFRRVGGLKDIPLNVRVIASSNRDLKIESEHGRFRLDLYYRLSVMQIDVPPLRERGGDVLLLAEHYISALDTHVGKNIRSLTPEVAAIFRRYPWPGNVRELRNVIERALLLEEGEVITTKYLPHGLVSGVEAAPPGGHEASKPERSNGRAHTPLPAGLSLDEIETSLVRQAVAQCGGNQTRAANLLGISRDRVRARLRKAQKFGHRSIPDDFNALKVGEARAEEELRVSRAQLSGIIGSAMDGIITVDEEQRIVLFNAAAETMFRCTAAEVTGQTLERFIPERLRALHRRHVQRFGQTKDGKRRMGVLASVSGLRADGEEFPVEASISQIEVDGKKLYTVILRDISERLEREDALRRAVTEAERSRAQLEAVFHSVTDGIVVSDMEGNILLVNEAEARINGYESAEEMRRNFSYFREVYELDHPDGRPVPVNEWPLARVLRGESVVNCELRVRRLDTGRSWFFSFSGEPVRDEKGEQVLAIMVSRDITEKKQLEDELLRGAQLTLIGEMAAGLAHEIKNPLAGIQGAADILIERCEPEDAKRQPLELIRREVGRVDATVRALLERARPHPLKIAPASLSEVVQRAVSVARHQSAGRAVSNGHRIELEFEPPPEPLTLALDASRIEDAVLNLIVNAIDAIEGEGRVTVRISRLKSEGGADSPDEALVEVEDTGRGIAEADLKKIFNPFFTGSARGSGLGLTAVNRIAHAHGGWVEVKSSVGEGSTFTLHLPLYPVTLSPQSKEPQAA